MDEKKFRLFVKCQKGLELPHKIDIKSIKNRRFISDRIEPCVANLESSWIVFGLDSVAKNSSSHILGHGLLNMDGTTIFDLPTWGRPFNPYNVTKSHSIFLKL